MVKFEPIFSLLLGVGVATTAYAATIPASSASHRDTEVGTGAEIDATAILAHFSNREELFPLAETQAETQLQDFFSRYGQCPAPSGTCHDYICLHDTPHCKPYSAEEQRETIEKTKRVLLDLISTVKCYPVPKGVDGCDEEGYCDVFKTKDLTDCKCRMLKKEEYADALAKHPDFAPHLGDDDENEEEPRRRKLQRRSEHAAFNPDKVEADPVFETNVEVLREIGLGQIGTCDVESRTCAKDHICKLGTANCRPFEAGKRIRFTETFIALQQKLIETGKCHRSSHNKHWCNQYGFCDVSEYRDDCRALEYSDDEKATNVLVLDDGKWVWPYEVQAKNDDELGTGTAKGKEPTHIYQHRDGDVDFTQYRTQPQQPAEGRDDQVQNFSSYLVTITEQPDMLGALYQAANVHDQPSMVQIREQLILLSHNKKATRKLLKSSSKRARAIKAGLLTQEPALYGRITKRSTDAGLQTVTFDPASTDPTPDPTSDEVCAFMEVTGNIHSDLTMVYALASVLGIESIGGVRTFWKQLHIWAADEKEAFKALKRGKLAAMLEESKSFPGASVSS